MPGKKQNKVVEDKTFGLKNKNKSKKVQQYVQQVKQQSKGGDAKLAKQLEKEREAAKKAKAEAAAMDQLVSSLTKTTTGGAMAAKMKGADPKSIVCDFYQRGLCKKGNKCKFSHDLSKVRKAPKANIYEQEKEDDTMDKWDETKLNEVVNKKHGNENPNNRTEIVCKYFIEAIETRKYGWFWECPNGGKSCKYRHVLPPGFVLKSQKKDEDEEEGPSIEEIIEEERKKITTFTPVTEETFREWKERQKEKRRKEMEAKTETKKSNAKKGVTDGMTGRDLFEFNRALFVDDDNAGEIDYKARTADEDEKAANAEKAKGKGERKEEDGDAVVDAALFGGGADDDLDDLSDD